MKFVFGVAVGALGMWAYSTGKLDSVMGHNAGQIRDMVSNVTGRSSDIVIPSAAEVSGRPAEPFPSSEAQAAGH